MQTSRIISLTLTLLFLSIHSQQANATWWDELPQASCKEGSPKCSKALVSAATVGTTLSDKSKQQASLFVDVRTTPEIVYLGLADLVDANIPYMEPDEMRTWDAKRKEVKLEHNTNFVAQVKEARAKKGLDANAPVFIMCRSGDRSAAAANLLRAQGFTSVFSVIDGFEGDKDSTGKRTLNGWKVSGLPWDYPKSPAKLRGVRVDAISVP